MFIEQNEIDALLKEANALVAEAVEEPEPPPPLPAAAPQLPTDPQLERILHLRVPVIVQLAQRPMPLATVRRLAVGSILEFEKSVEHPLDLLVNDRNIGEGVCVKVGENFGLRVTRICDKLQRVRSLGA